MIRFRATLITIIIGNCAVWAPAQTTLKVDIGWNNHYRVGRWCPVFVTASDPRPRNVTIELRTPHDPAHAMRIHQSATVGPSPVTFGLVAPLAFDNEGFTVTLRDADNGRTLASAAPLDWQSSQTPARLQTTPQLIGISGGGTRNALLEGQLNVENIAAASIPQLRLPVVAMGYDALNLLVLDQPDLTQLSPEQQNAILDWVRAGGSLVCWLSADAIPAHSPLIRALPARVGDNSTYTISSDALKAAGLPARFAGIKGRSLTPGPGATPIAMFDGQISALRTRYGFGSIVLLPIDASSLMFDTSLADPSRLARAFWNPLLSPAVEMIPAAVGSDVSSEQSFSDAASRARDVLGNVPGAGNTGLPYLTVLIGMMLVVGPLDWIVLKMRDRQPWTVITVAGWIALVALGTISIGHYFNRGELHPRTLRLIDQADGLTAATTDALCIYSPQTANYPLDFDRAGWWEPLAPRSYARPSGMISDVAFHQDQHGNRAEAMWISGGKASLLIGRTLAAAAPAINARLRIESPPDGKPRLAGTITNLSDAPFTRLRARVESGICEIPVSGFEPGKTVQVNVPILPRPPAGPGPLTGENGLFNLAADRSIRIEEAIGSPSGRDMVCILAESSDAPTPPVSLRGASGKQQHAQLIRALLRLEESGI